MYNNQLDFGSEENNNYFIFNNDGEEEGCGNYRDRNFREGNQNMYYNMPDSEHYIEDVKYFNVDRNVNNDEYAYEMQPQFNEQLDYMIQNNVNSILPQDKPNPLIYNARKN